MCKIFKVIILSLVVISLIMGTVSVSFAQKEAQGVKVYNSPSEYQKATGRKIARYSESPMLAELVKAKKLPPVEERLPKNPVVVEPLEEIGQYGGTWYIAVTGRHYALLSYLGGRIADMDLFQYDFGGTRLLPNLVDRWKVSRDARTYTLHFREGLKWSDGEPFTTDDIMFWYKEMLTNKELYPNLPGWMRMGDKVIEINQIDKYTIEFKLPSPNGVFLYNIQGSFPLFPKHYLKQFHPNYTPIEKLTDMAKKAGFEAWHQYFWDRANGTYYTNPDCPVMRMWKVVSITPSRVVAERNPYYWKVDIEGNQLPYIDKVVIDIVSNAEVVKMKAMSGELSLQTFHFSLADYPLLKEGEKKGGYRVMLWPSTGADAVLMINHTYNEDPVIAKLLNDVRFKRALSLAINREEINQLYALGLARATQYSPSTTDPVYEKRYSEAYSKFDPATANKLLDSIGLVKRDKDGYRLRPDGKRLTISILVATDWPMHSDICEMLRKYWKDIGIELLIQPTSFELRSQRIAANAHQIVIWKIDVLFYPHYINLARGAMSAFSEGPDAVGPLWRDWELSGGKSGVKPPEDWFKVKEYLEKAASSPSERERILYAKKMWDLYIKNLWSIGVLQQLPIPIVVKDNFRNVPDKLPNSWTIRTPVNGSVEQFFIKQ